ncbi:hypothetical protein TPHA_0C00870 [Tetrapisispora phaffii CBS 4417]|uniref:Uncharacterized protein n=1 Tax=Tetrapisispora phaffii (strain ATCC 24235 / CBS 4417 / NBRC 1672 / NRRL Y-8282 / UCD 70-5) TaxID=1071381 RepID=G8BR67_TETPH|nr:hypothetical protein TPHA_0C00870 [Tetrapisispora phaffii CBS 4417]CCE62243.1 hypothetical protein TPHA_0C00870 [Tetrapisispora phaffii CBS 4417]
MSQYLKPLSVDSKSTVVDAKQKKFEANVEYALQYFDTVAEWADYIANLGKLLKVLQSWTPQFHNVKYYVPLPYQVSRRLTSSLLPSLPAGVHKKTLEVYTYIFSKIGIEALSAECNIWVPGILPLMTYASMSVKSQLIELYDTYLTQVNITALQIIIKPLLASLLTGIDDDSSEFQPLVFRLIETVRGRLNNDSLFWKSFFLILITNKEHRLGGIALLTKKLPSLNAIPHKKATIAKSDEEKNIDETVLTKQKLMERGLSTLLPGTEDLVKEEPGLLIRAFVSCMKQENDILIKRGILDLMVQRVHLDSPVIQIIISKENKELLLIECCKIMLSRDMSLNRRIWNWLLGPNNYLSSNSSSKITNNSSEAGDGMKEQETSNSYFVKFGLDPILNSLRELMVRETTLPVCFNICTSMLDKYELSSLIIPKLFLPLMLATMRFQSNDQIMDLSNSFLNSIDTDIIWTESYQYIINSDNFEYLDFLLSNLNFKNYEELTIRHLPLIFLTLFEIQKNKKDRFLYDGKFINILMRLIELIPSKAFTPIDNIDILSESKNKADDVLTKLTEYYKPTFFSNGENNIKDLTKSCFDLNTLTLLIYNDSYQLLSTCLNSNINTKKCFELYMAILDNLQGDTSIGKSEEYNYHTIKVCSLINQYLDNSNIDDETIYIINKFFIKHLASKISVIESNKLLKKIMQYLWNCLLMAPTKLDAVKCIDALADNIPPGYIEEQLAYSFIQETDIANKIFVLDLLWNHLDKDVIVLGRTVDLLLDYLFDKQSTFYLYASQWLQEIKNNNTIDKLYDFILTKLLKFEFLNRNSLHELDDLEMFTYKIQSLINILETNEGEILEDLFTKQTKTYLFDKNKETNTYSSLIINILIQLLKMSNNHHVESVRSSLILLDLLLNGEESNCKEIVIFLLEMSSNYGSKGDFESESIAVSLINIVSKVLHESYANNVKLDIFEDNTIHLKYLDYLVTSVPKMEGTLIISAYVKLLLESFAYFENSIFRIIVPLTGSIIECIQTLCSKTKESDKFIMPIILLLNGLEKLLMNAYKKLEPTTEDSFFSATSVGSDFLQSMVSNVFISEGSSSSKNSQGQYNVLFQSFKQILHCCLEVWESLSSLPGFSKSSGSKQLITYNSKRLNDKIIHLIYSLFNLEPIETIECISTLQKDSIYSLLSSLMNTYEIDFGPFILYDITIICNKGSELHFSINSDSTTINKISRNVNNHNSKISTKFLVKFLLEYILEVSDFKKDIFLKDLSIFFKHISNNYLKFEDISLELLQMYSIVAQEVGSGKIENNAVFKKDLSDTFIKYLPNAINLRTSDTEEQLKMKFKTIKLVVSNIHLILDEKKESDKFQNCLSTIISIALQPIYKKLDFDSLPDEFYELSLAVTINSNGDSLWNTIINNTYNNDKIFKSLELMHKLSPIFLIWSNYSTNKTNLIATLLLGSDPMPLAIRPSVISFNSWNYSELDIKFIRILKISYLILINKNDNYLLSFKELIEYVCQSLLSHETKLKTASWILLRSLLFKYSESHFHEYWPLISYCLQTNLQDFYEKLKLQVPIDANNVLQMAKSLDLLLLFNFEDFSATNEWLFIIDSINCISKEGPYMSLSDIIGESKEYETLSSTISPIKLSGPVNSLLLLGINNIDSHFRLKDFFKNISYFHYEYVYSLEKVDMKPIEKDLIEDIFWA